LFGAQPISGKDVVVAEAITAVRTADAGAEVEEPVEAAAVAAP
jgi:hypothetical protein